MPALTAISQQIGCNGFFPFQIRKGENATDGRMFSPAIGIVEDPVTGNANGPMGAWLVQHGLMPHDGKTLRVQGHQGRALGRDGIVDVTVAIRENLPEKVTITGSAVILFHAEWAIDFNCSRRPDKAYNQNRQTKANFKIDHRLKFFLLGRASKYFCEKNLESVFSMRDIRRTFKTLSGTLHFTENEKDIVNQHANKIIEKHYDRYDYIIEKREITLKWEKALQVPLSNDGLNEINLIIEKKRVYEAFI